MGRRGRETVQLTGGPGAEGGSGPGDVGYIFVFLGSVVISRCTN